MGQKKRQPKTNPPVRTSPPPKGQWMKATSQFMKKIRPPRVGGRKR